MRRSDRNFTKIPDGKLGIIALEGCKELGKTIDNYIIQWRSETYKDFKDSVACDGYLRDTYLLDASCPRFGSGEAKGIIRESVRDMDLYIIVDVLNYSVTYSLSGRVNHMSPDDHYADLKRIISAAAGKAKSINVIMPFLYESRQHKRSTRESLDCAVMLQELLNLGVDNILTFDAHDPRVQNAIPISGFDNIQPTYQFVKSLVEQCDDVHFDNDHLMVISPDEGAMQRAIYMANVVGVDVGMFYKRRDYSTVIDGRNPIVAHEFLGDSLDGKDVLIIDDMISSGESMIDVAKELKRRNARRVFCLSTFGLFTNGLEVFDRAVEEGIIEKVITTNLTYQTPELLSRDWYASSDVSKYVALLIDTLNHDASISDLLNPTERIKEYLEKKNPPAILPIQIAYYAGLRIGETCGLTWQDINLEEQCLTIKRSIRYDGMKHKNIIGPTKRKKVRIVDFGDTLTEILKSARKEQLKNRMQYGELYHRNYYKEVHVKNRVYYEYYHLDGTQEVPADYKKISFVCLRPDGSLELPSTLGIVCRSVSKRLDGFEDFHFHQLRHTYTSNLLSNGAAPKDVQELLGHSDVSTTMNIYAHSTRKAKRDSARLLDKVASNA